jgi:dolichyl-phosphate beta-glucosyltransferase
VSNPGEESTGDATGARLVYAVALVGRHVLWIVLFTVPAVVLWWHVWAGHPATTLTCPCGDPAQEVWFMAWPAWAIPHVANPFFSGAVNVPFGANLLSNTSGPLVGTVLSPVTWLWGPVVATNVAVTLAPGLSAWGCWLALQRFVTWRPAALPGAFVYGYSSAVMSSLIFAHVSVSVLLFPPLLFATVYEIAIRQDHSPLRDGLTLGGLAVAQFLISPEVLVMCALLGGVGLVATVVAAPRHVAARWPHAWRALGLGVGAAAVLLAYPAWFGLRGPQAVTGVLFSIAPLSGVMLSGYFSPGNYAAFANSYVRFGGYFGRFGPPPNFLGWGIGLGTAASVVVTRRRRIVWLLIVLILVTAWLSLGSYFLGSPHALAHIWLPWRSLGQLPVLKEILADQFAPLLPFFVALLLGLGLEEAHRVLARQRWRPAETSFTSALLVGVVGVVALVPVFVTFDMPLTVQSTAIPYWMAHQAADLPNSTVLLTVPFPVSGSTAPMLWQAVDGMRFRLAGAGLKTPNAKGGPVGQGAPGSARRILADLTLLGHRLPSGTPAQMAAVRHAVGTWGVNEVVIDGVSRDPVYASGFLTEALGVAPSVQDGAWVWKVPPGGLTGGAITGVPLSTCQSQTRGTYAGHDQLAMADCVLGGNPAPGAA